MAIAFHRAGSTLVEVGDGADDLQTLGYTDNGVEISQQNFMLDIPSDLNGGDSGPPSEIQHLGQIHRISCRLTKFDKAISNDIENGLRDSATPGDLPVPGQFMFQDTERFYVKITGAQGGATGHVRTYTKCVIRDAITLNLGTKFQMFVVVFEAYQDSTTFNLWS